MTLQQSQLETDDPTASYMLQVCPHEFLEIDLRTYVYFFV